MKRETPLHRIIVLPFFCFGKPCSFLAQPTSHAFFGALLRILPETAQAMKQGTPVHRIFVLHRLLSFSNTTWTMPCGPSLFHFENGLSFQYIGYWRLSLRLLRRTAKVMATKSATMNTALWRKSDAISFFAQCKDNCSCTGWRMDETTLLLCKNSKRRSQARMEPLWQACKMVQ